MKYELFQFTSDYYYRSPLLYFTVEDAAKVFFKHPKDWVKKIELDEDGIFSIELNSSIELSAFANDCKHTPLFNGMTFTLFEDRMYEWCKNIIDKQDAIDQKEADERWNEMFPD